MSCINFKHPEILKMAEELNVSPAVLGAKVGVWQERNGIEDRFPTSEEIMIGNEFTSNEKFEDKFKGNINDNVDPIFSEEYNEPMGIEEVSRPQSSEVKTNKILFNNRSGNNFTVNEILDNIVQNVEGVTPEGLEFIERSKGMLSKSGAKIKFVSADNFEKNAVMKWDSETNTILISRVNIYKYSAKNNVEAFLHEVVHSIVAEALMNPQSMAEKEFSRFVNEFYNKYEDLSDSYGFTNVMEFAAEMVVNKLFREEVESLSKETKDSYYQKFLNAIRRLFGIKKTSEFDSLFKQILEYSQEDRSAFQGFGDNDYGQFAKEVEYKKQELVTLEDRLNNVVDKAKDRMDQAYKRAKSNNKISQEDKDRNLQNIKSLIDEMESYSDIQNWKSVVAYTSSLSKLVKNLKRSFDKKDLKAEGSLELINNFESYLSAYDLMPEINKLLSESKTEINDPEVQEDIEEIRSLLRGFEGDHRELVSDFETEKEQQSLAILSNAKYNSKVENDHKARLEKEYKDLKITGETKNEYVTRMLNTRDKPLFQEDLIKQGKALAKNPTMDISSIVGFLSDSLNISSRLIEVVVKMVNETRESIISQFNTRDKAFGKLFKEFIAEKGNNAPSKLYGNQIQKNEEGVAYLRGNFDIKFLDEYNKNFKPILAEKFELISGYKKQNLTSKEYSAKQEFKDVIAKELAWKKEHTKQDGTSKRNFVPADKYKNPALTGMDKVLNEEFRNISKEFAKNTNNRGTLIKQINGGGKYIMFYKLPSHSKSDIERRLELDVKGLTKDKFTDFTKIKADDIGYQSIDSDNNLIKRVKINYRGKIENDEQSLDLMTMYRLEYLNGINYKEKSKIELKVNLIADIAKNKDYYKSSNKSKIPTLNVFATRQPTVTFKGENSNEYKKIVGIIDSNVYDIMNSVAPQINGKDVGKMSSFVSGFTAKISMIGNIASGTANVTNGTSQLIIESMGGNFISKKSLFKAEARYITELPSTLADLSNPVKTSFVNQVVRMFDVAGNLSIAEQTFIKNTMLKKLASTESLNAINETGEHMMNSVLTMGILDTLKVMNSNYKFIDINGKIVEESKAASLLDMLSMNSEGDLEMSPLVAFTNKNMTVNYHKGGKVDINLLIKNKIHDLFGVYGDIMQNEMNKEWYGKAINMFKKFFISGLQYRWKGVSKSTKSKDDLTEDDLDYNAYIKEYQEGTYVTMIRFFSQGVIPALKGLQLAYASDYYNNLTDYEKANLKKVTVELIIRGVLLPSIGIMLAGAAEGGDDDDDMLWFWVYQTRRLESELSQFYDPIEATRLITNPVAGVRTVQNALALTYDLLTPIKFITEEGESNFDWLNEDSKGKNKTLKKFKKLTPVWSQFDRNWQQMHSFIDK